MSKKISNITELTEGFQDAVILKAENERLIKVIEALRKELMEKTEKLSHMETLMIKTIPAFVKVSPEEEICEIQIQMLRSVSKDRELTLEETKKLDILIKNKRLSQEQSTVNMQARNVEEVSDAILLQIAESKDGRSENN